MRRARWTVGIDEVGRGALAGPVVVAAAALRGGRAPSRRAPGILKDSKKLSAARREEWAAFFSAHPRHAVFALARVYPRQIERRNISQAANLAAARAFRKLEAIARLGKNTPVFLDGGLFLGSGASRAAFGARAKTIVKGDEKIAAIKAASIVAKVRRDGLMRRLAKRYPAYGFEVHKGYGTAAHRAALRARGPSPAHRLTFIGKSATIQKKWEEYQSSIIQKERQAAAGRISR